MCSLISVPQRYWVLSFQKVLLIPNLLSDSVAGGPAETEREGIVSQGPANSSKPVCVGLSLVMFLISRLWSIILCNVISITMHRV